ncbi:MAG: bifunctional hydroxymethylpyrimidine kinase/phosphomethylpyrimidine kinase [Blautia sp.]|nr:bifunctional hydroxymethylpyrimidine kinase/phosphomethylpyrimidine kinase [Blautia sp.]
MGRCSLTASIPVLSVMGVQPVPAPTAILSNQTGYRSCYFEEYTDRLSSFADEWQKIGFTPDGIYTGFLKDAVSVKRVASMVTKIRVPGCLLIVDPIMGDNGNAFPMYSEEFLLESRKLIRMADVITPNLTEAILLLAGIDGLKKEWNRLGSETGEEKRMHILSIAEALSREYGIGTVVITGIEEGCGMRFDDGAEGSDDDKEISNLILQKGNGTFISSRKIGGSYSGTGDLFTSVLAAGMVNGIDPVVCGRKACRFLNQALELTVQEGTDRNEGLHFEPFLGELLPK